PALVNFDFSLFKEFRPAEGKTIQFRTEMFSIFNHPNFAIPNSANRVVFTSPTMISANAGLITSTVTTSRQIQFGLKFAFYRKVPAPATGHLNRDLLEAVSTDWAGQPNNSREWQLSLVDAPHQSKTPGALGTDCDREGHAVPILLRIGQAVMLDKYG